MHGRSGVDNYVARIQRLVSKQIMLYISILQESSDTTFSHSDTF